MPTSTETIDVTPLACQKVNEIIQAENAVGKALRVFVEGGGCSGFQYGFDLDDKRDGDQVFNYQGFDVVIDPVSWTYLKGMKIDYVDGIQGAGFKIDNPNSKGSCGCGSSFNA
jgi:iron-sulfur cluster assembly accessory protein